MNSESSRAGTWSRLLGRGVSSAGFGLGLVLVVGGGCAIHAPDPADHASVPLPAVDGAVATVDPLIYTRVDDPTDPFAYKYAEFRARRSRDMASDESPPALGRYPARHRTRAMPWDPLEQALPFDWARLRAEQPAAVDQLVDAVRLRLAFDHPDLEIRQLMIGSGAVLPRHAEGAPGMFVVIGGRGEISVEGETHRVTVGSTVKLEPYATRRLRAGPEEPLRVLWIRWAPGGDQAYIDSGYYLTGANQHVQPAEARFDEGYQFFAEPDRGYGKVEGPSSAPVPSTALRRARRELGAETALYPRVPVFGHESEIEWLSAETLKAGGFFFSEDLGAMLDVADTMIEIARHKAIFRASRPDGRWDFNFSESAWGPRATYVEHSHVIPEFYYVLSGPVIYGVDGDRHPSLPGDILFNNSYSPHLAQGVVDGLVFRSFSSTFAPNGDRSVFERPFFLEEALPTQPGGAKLARDVDFH